MYYHLLKLEFAFQDKKSFIKKSRGKIIIFRTTKQIKISDIKKKFIE